MHAHTHTLTPAPAPSFPSTRIRYIVSAPLRARWNKNIGRVAGGVLDWGAAAVGWSDDDDDHGGGTVAPVDVGSGRAPTGTQPLVAEATASRNGLATSWPARCDRGLVPVVYPNSSAARSAHMAGLTVRIGGCSEVVPAVMRDQVTTHTEGKRGSCLVAPSTCVLFLLLAAYCPIFIARAMRSAS